MQALDYTVGWICAVQTEYVVACELLDEEHPPLPTTSLQDDNVYTLGRIGDHNVVMACLPKGQYGLTSAASVAKDMLRSFSQLRFGLMVGIGGGAPSRKHDIRLGDVVVSSPVKRTGGVIHYESGKTIQDKKFERTGSLDAPPSFLLAALSKLSSLHERNGHGIAQAIEEMVAQNPRLKNKYQQENCELDRLYKPTYIHAEDGQDCQVVCDTGTAQLIERKPRGTDEDNPAIHYGLIASADRLMQDATARDILAKEEEVLCFEMEAAGLMNHFRCVVIRGICDYSDTHKNDVWQGYAAATAAAYAKELLCVIPGREVDHTSTMLGTTREKAQAMPAHPGFPMQFSRDNGFAIREEVNSRLETELERQHSASPFLDGPFDLLSVSFTGREAELDQLGQWVKSRSTQSTVRYLVHGMPGVGKSQLALQFAQNAFETKEYSYILWISASSEEKVTQGFVSLFDKLGIRDTAASDQSVWVAALRRWLECSHEGKSDRWLLIFDNVDRKTSQILRSMLPRTHPGGAILFTSRNEDVALNLSTHRNQELITLELQPFSEREATGFLSRVAGLSAERITDANDADVKDLANIVGRLPLAIDQAAAFMRLGYSVKDMLDLHRSDERLKILEWENRFSTYEEKSVAATFNLAFQEVRRESPVILNFLCLLSCLDPEGVPFKMIVSGAKRVEPSIIETQPTATRRRSRFMQKVKKSILGSSKLTENASTVVLLPSPTTIPEQDANEFQALISMLNSPVKLQEAIDKLQNLSLVKRQQKDNHTLLGMHDLVQYLVQNKLMDDTQRHMWLEAAITLICGAFKEFGDPWRREAWPACEVFVNQIQALARNCEKHTVENDDLLEAQAGIAGYFFSLGQYAEAGVLRKAIYEHYRTKRGQAHEQTLDAAVDLGFTYTILYRLEDARSLFEMAYQADREQLGENHPRVFRTMWALASMALKLGQNGEAERLCKLCLQGHEMCPGGGLNHPDTLRAARLLGLIYKEQGRYQEAEIMFRKVFDRSPGGDDLDTIFAVEDLAINYSLRQRYYTVLNLALLYHQNGRYDDAEALCQRVRMTAESKLGPNHGLTLRAVQLLALSRAHQGQIAEAEELLLKVLGWQKAHEGLEFFNGGTHPFMLNVAVNLALLYYQNGRDDDAEALCQRVRMTAESKFGPNHDLTLRAVQLLALSRAHEGQIPEAEELLLKVLEGQKQSLGLDDPLIIGTEEMLKMLKETGTLDVKAFEWRIW